MPEPRIFFRKLLSETGTKFPAARVVDRDGTVLVQSDLTGTIALQVFDLSGSDPETAIFSTNRTVGSTVFNSLQVWQEDSIGFNFRDSITSNEVSWDGDKTYRMCYTLRHTSQGNLTVVFEGRTLPLLGA